MDTPFRPREIFTVVPRILHWRDEGIMPILEKKFAERCTTMVPERKAPFNIDSKTIVMSLMLEVPAGHGIYPVPHTSFPLPSPQMILVCFLKVLSQKLGPQFWTPENWEKKQPGKQLERTK